MPCFKGLAVSIHTPEGPLPEYSIQKQSRFSRISSYIPVPPPKVPQDSQSNKPEQSTFAISITLLTPGLNVPYSAPKATSEDPYPRPRVVSGLPNITSERGRYFSAIGPYMPLTTSPNETLAAYIYFDGRAKEEVATLLRRGEETWVNSRWVSVPDSEGGGLAEREFLFREVGLERWLNGLDLEGKNAAAIIERRRQRMEKRRRRRKVKEESDEETPAMWGRTDRNSKNVLRYGVDERSPLEQMSDEDVESSSGSDEDDDPVPEATGQIKVALFRVLASGEIKKGEYSPQFDAHDDDEDTGRTNAGAENGNGESTEEVDHTTSFAQPKTLDPKSISTQTVTGIDPPDKPFAVFTFLYRGQKQLQKLGILPSSKVIEKPAASAKRKSIPMDFSGLKPLTSGGTLGFSSLRDSQLRDSSKNGAIKKELDDMDSEEDEEFNDSKAVKEEDLDPQDSSKSKLSPDDLKRQGEISEGVRKIKLKRQHSAEAPESGSAATRDSPASRTPTAGSTPPAPSSLDAAPPSLLPSSSYMPQLSDEAVVGSPLKRARASVSGIDDDTLRQKIGLGESGLSADIMGRIEQDRAVKKEKDDEDEEL